MLVHELSAAECAAVLRRTHIGRLACARAGQPYVVPVSFAFDEEHGCVYSISSVGQKIDWMRQNPLVCLEVDEIADTGQWQTVLAFGMYEELDNDPGHADARQRAHERFEVRKEWWFPAVAKLPTREERHAVVVYRIRIDRLTGRRAGSA